LVLSPLPQKKDDPLVSVNALSNYYKELLRLSSILYISLGKAGSTLLIDQSIFLMILHAGNNLRKTLLDWLKVLRWLEVG
jgi:hypothetical protein